MFEFSRPWKLNEVTQQSIDKSCSENMIHITRNSSHFLGIQRKAIVLQIILHMHIY